MGTGKRRSGAQIARDRQRIADLYLQGWVQADIGKEIGVSQATVSRDLKALHQKWSESALINFNEAKAQELAKIDRLEREYWRAWLRSCENAETVRQEETPNGDPGRVVKTSKGQTGDPRFLQGIQWCIDKRCKILGLDAPQKHAIVDWREEAKERGLDPTGIFEQLVQDISTAIQEGDGSGNGGSVDRSGEADTD